MGRKIIRMKKFAFLLALAAAFAMSAAAWAAMGDTTLSTATDYSATGQNNGAISGGRTNLYYYGGTAAPDEFKLGADIAIADGDRSSSDPVWARWSKAADFSKRVEVSSGIALTLPNKTITVDGTGMGKAVFENDDTIRIGAYDLTNDRWEGTPALLKIVPTEVTFDTAPITKAGDLALEFGTALEVYDGASKVSAAVDGMTFTGTKTGMTISGTPTKAGTYTLTLKTAAAEDSLKIKEKGETAKQAAVKVAADALKAKDVATVVITVADLIVTPESATWVIGASDDLVAFKVDTIGFGEFMAISTDMAGYETIITAADHYAANSFVSADRALIVSGATMDVYLYNALLADMGSKIDSDREVKFGISTVGGKSCVFTVKFVRKGDQQQKPSVSQNTVVPEHDPNDPAPLTVDFGKEQAVVSRDEISDPKLAALFEDDGTISINVVVDAPVNVSAELLTILQGVVTNVMVDGNYAPITIGSITPDMLVSPAVTEGIRWTDAIVHKLYLDDDGDLAYTTLYPAARMSDIEGDAVFQLFDAYGRSLVDPELMIRAGNSETYTLVVYVKDNSMYDLDRTGRYILDPIVLQQKSAGSNSSSSGACSAGFGLAALAAAIAIKKSMRRRS